MKIGVDARVLAFSPVHRAGAYYWNLNLISALAKNDAQNQYLLFCGPSESHLIPDFGPNFSILEIQAFREYSASGQLEEQIFLEKELNPLGLDLYLGLYFVVPLFRNFPAISIYDDMIPWILMKKENHLIPSDHLVGKDMRYFQYWKRLSARSAEGLVAVSDSTARDMVRYWKLPENRFFTVHESIEPDFDRPVSEEELREFRDRYKLPEEYILYVATIEPRKNVVGLIRALKILRTRYQNSIPLVMVGPRGLKYKEVFEKTVYEELGGFDGILLYSDHVPRKDLPLFYKAAKIFCFPSFYEGFGLTLLEAITCGVPAVTSPVSSLPEVAGKAALYADPFKPEEIADVMNALLISREKREELSKEAFLQSRKFSYSRSAEKLLGFMTEVAGKNRNQYALRSSAPGMEKVQRSRENPAYPEVLFLKTAPKDQAEEGIDFVRKVFKTSKIHLVTQQGDSSWQETPELKVYPVLPKGLLKGSLLPLLPWKQMREIPKQAIILIYNNPSGHGYDLWRKVVFMLGKNVPVYAYIKGGHFSKLSRPEMFFGLMKPLKLLYCWIRLHLRLLLKHS